MIAAGQSEVIKKRELLTHGLLNCDVQPNSKRASAGVSTDVLAFGSGFHGQLGLLNIGPSSNKKPVPTPAVLALDSDSDPRREQMKIEKIDGYERIGSSSAQSLARGSQTIETDYLAGEIALLGRLHGVATPVNERLQRINREMAAAGEAPGTRDAEALIAEFGLAS